MESFIRPTDFISKYKNCAYIECYMTYLFPKKDINSVSVPISNIYIFPNWKYIWTVDYVK